jgi:hypothetical protein
MTPLASWSADSIGKRAQNLGEGSANCSARAESHRLVFVMSAMSETGGSFKTHRHLDGAQWEPGRARVNEAD